MGPSDDKIGIATAINGLSKITAITSRRGLGILIGDGALNYRQEKI
jgi:high affinity Mn2+ porin